jgi:hypothetical protein
MAPHDSRPPLTEVEAAKYIGMSVSWLRQSRMRGSGKVGPDYQKAGKSVRYPIPWLDEWREARRQSPYRIA